MKTKLSSLQIYPLPTSPLSYFERLTLKYSSSLGVCPVCGKPTIFRNFTENFRESGLCIVCQSSNRQRQMAFILLASIYETTKIKFSSVKEFAATALQFPIFSDFKILNTETTGSLHNYLKNLNFYCASEYLGDKYNSGDIIDGILHQDLMKTSFNNSSIDIVMSSDVFEHIPEPYKAFSEIYRILKPAGRHIFTVPFYSESYKDEVRATIDKDGTIKNFLPPIYHGDPMRPEGILVYTIFSMEMLVKLSDIGYQVKMYNVRNPWLGILGDNAIVFDSVK